MSVISFFLVFCAIIFWGFRVYVCLMYSMQQDFFVEPMNFKLELALLFLSIFLIVGIVRRSKKIVTIYTILYLLYFGKSFYNYLSVNNIVISIINILGMFIPFLTFCDVMFAKSLYAENILKQSSWYFDNTKYDRKFDERADRNQYKIK